MISYIAATCISGSGIICGDSLPHSPANDQTLKTTFLIVYGIIGGLALLFMIIAGARYALSKGEPDNIQKAKNEMKYTLIGLIIATLAAAIVNFVIDRIQQ